MQVLERQVSLVKQEDFQLRDRPKNSSRADKGSNWDIVRDFQFNFIQGLIREIR